MTYLNEKTAELDTEIINQLPQDCNVQRWTTKQHGVCRMQFDQNHGGFLLHDEDGNKVTIDNSFNVQLIHVHVSTPKTDSNQFGSYEDKSYRYDMKLIVLTDKKTVMERVLQGIEETTDIVFFRVNADTEQVLKNELKINIGPDKNYPPEYRAYSFSYQFTTIEPIIEDEE